MKTSGHALLIVSILLLLLLFACNNNASSQSQPLGEPATPVGHPSPSVTTQKRPANLSDTGIWDDLNSKTWLLLPGWIDKTQTHVVIDKAGRVLTLMQGQTAVISYPIALGFAPVGHKKKQGDGKTPEGLYYLCENLHKNLAARYGARSMRISYPNALDANRGLETNLISNSQKRAIEKAISSGKMPPQNTPLGSSIRIHGGGVGRDWTLGCIAMRDEDIVDLYKVVRLGTKVRILGADSKAPYSDMDKDGIPDQVDILLGAKKTVLNAATYNGKYVKIPSGNGDVPREIGVCTDVIIRVLRNAGLDIQTEIQKDRAKRPKAYPRIKQPDPSIDHRRVKNMIPWFEKHWQSLQGNAQAVYLPGDVILMDTLPAQGADHIGIISDRAGPSGKPLVINNWTVGYETSEMDLLDFVPVLGHYRCNNN